MRLRTLAGLGAIVFLCLVYCGNDNVAGNTSEVGNPTVAAMLCNPGGSPAAGATVRFIPADYNPRTGLPKALAAVDSTTTDANGNYQATLDSGTYNVLAEGDSGVVYQDSITVIPDSTVRPPDDTLGAPGSVRGVVRLQPGDDSRTVFILLMGTQTWVAPDDSVGNFSAGNLAEGNYRVRILTTLDHYAVMDTSLNVAAGRDSVLADTIRLRFTGIPTPTGVVLTYDTLRQIVTLAWDRADTNLVASYNVYRRNVGLNTVLARMNASPVTDTVYRDSSGVQDSTYEYQVAAVNGSGTEGTKSAVIGTTISSAYLIAATIGSSGTGPGQFTNILDMCFDSNGALYVASAEDGTSANARVQKISDDSAFVLSFGATGGGTGQFLEPRGVAVDDSLRILVAERGNRRIQIFDSAGLARGYLSDSLAGSPWQILPVGGAYYVAEYHEADYYSTIARVNGDGTIAGRFGEKGNADGQFWMVWTLQATTDGQIAALDENGIQFFTADGQFARKLPLRKYGVPQDFAMADSSLYVTFILSDSLRSVMILGMNGELRARWFTSLPAFQIAVRSGRIYVSDFAGGRVLVYRRM